MSFQNMCKIIPKTSSVSKISPVPQRNQSIHELTKRNKVLAKFRTPILMELNQVPPRTATVQ